jgi:hypothetical protein
MILSHNKEVGTIKKAGERQNRDCQQREKTGVNIGER